MPLPPGEYYSNFIEFFHSRARVINMNTNKVITKTQLSRILLTEQAIHGLILVAGMIVISRKVTGSSLSALVTVFLTMTVFFAGHVYSETVARLARTDKTYSFRESIVLALKHSSGMMIFSLIPILVLALGVSDLVEDNVAVWLALIVSALLLAAVGWITMAHKTEHFLPRLLSALTTAGFGAAIIALKVFFYH